MPHRASEKLEGSVTPPMVPWDSEGRLWTQQSRQAAFAGWLTVHMGLLGGGEGVRTVRAAPGIPGALAAEGQTSDPECSAQFLSASSPLPGPSCWPGHAPALSQILASSA